MKKFYVAMLIAALLLTPCMAQAENAIPTFPPRVIAPVAIAEPEPEDIADINTADTAVAATADGETPMPAAMPSADEYAQSLLEGGPSSDGERQVTDALYGYSTQTEMLYAEFESTLPARGEQPNVDALRQLGRTADTYENVLDRFEDILEASYRAGDFDKATYRIFERELDRIDDQLDDIEDYLEDYWDDDDDDYDDDDD